MGLDRIVIRGAREHNLKNISLELPRNSLVVVTGISGSGKSSLAFDTLFAEGQRRYVESLSAYARQFLGQLEKPDVDYIEGLSPAISIDQKRGSQNPRSTVGTVTEIYDYLRLLYARVGHPHCPTCGRPIVTQTVQQMVDQILALPKDKKALILAPLVRGRKGEYTKLLEKVRQQGYQRARIDGKVLSLDQEVPLGRYQQHSIEVVVDRVVLKDGLARRLADSLEITLKLGQGRAVVQVEGMGDLIFSEALACPECGISLEELQPRLFSFNSPFGACPQCTGLGFKMELDPDLVIPNPDLTIWEGAIAPLGKPIRSFRHHPSESWLWSRLWDLSQELGFNWETPWRQLSSEHQQVILNGNKGRRRGEGTSTEGVMPNLERRYRETESERLREEIERFMAFRPCPVCEGARLKPEALAVSVGELSISQVTALSVTQAEKFFSSLALTGREQLIARQIIKEIMARLRFMIDVGLDYLTLDRTAGSLAGGEAQRIRLATQIGSALVGVLYIMDEPSIGLHQRDNRRLLATLKHLRDLGNTLVVVEHDEETIRSADHVVDVGPGAGIHGGEVVVAGTPQAVSEHADSITGQYLSGRLAIPVPPRRRACNGQFLELLGARHHNLKHIDARFPLGCFVCVTGVSGSGKSSLVDETLHRALAQVFHHAHEKPGAYDQLRGMEYLDKVIIIDQSPIGRTPRSNPATYTNLFTYIRDLFSLTPEARMRGYKAGRFSFNVKGGRCEACAGQGILKIEMHFLPDVYVPCEICKGKRYNRETLEIAYKGKNIAEVLEMTVEEALEFFRNIPPVRRKLQTLYDVGLGYVHLGQAATTLSGGEAQRVKLATELSRHSNGRTLYMLDEPTTGLHFHDVAKLLEVLLRLVDTGNTVLTIEHNLEVIKTADYLIDLGPEGGDEGGEIVAQGTPEEVAANPRSYTGQYLLPILTQAGVMPGGVKQKRKRSVNAARTVAPRRALRL